MRDFEHLTEVRKHTIVRDSEYYMLKFNSRVFSLVGKPIYTSGKAWQKKFNEVFPFSFRGYSEEYIETNAQRVSKEILENFEDYKNPTENIWI